ncbi:septum formation initiator family protein [Streptomyces sp. NPDC007205]|uniref:septum formation initiator family protein n=1 Tax=Streptomyces sp. NPDC007205 TaxID=3154316 RepID=UPI0033D3B22F
MSRKPALRGRAARLTRLFPAGRARAARTPFVLLVVLLLGGGLIGLLVLNSALSEGSFKLDALQKETRSLTDEKQALQRDIDAYSDPAALQRRARELGMVPGGDPAFLGPDGTVKGVPGVAGPGPAALTAPVAPEPLTPAAAFSAPPSTLASAPPAQGQPQPVPVPSAPAAAAPPLPAIPQPIPTPTPGR